jgi:hypothetical protein
VLEEEPPEEPLFDGVPVPVALEVALPLDELLLEVLPDVLTTT